jgi:hypothetical protein
MIARAAGYVNSVEKSRLHSLTPQKAAPSERLSGTQSPFCQRKFSRLLIDYREHPEAKSLGPDGTPCKPDTQGLLKLTQVVAGEFRYIGKETDRKWEEGDEISILEFKTTEYGRSRKVIATEEIKKKILEIGINKCARESGFDRKNFIRKLTRGNTRKT